MAEKLRSRRKAPPLWQRLKALLAGWLGVREPYRPEQHYMRGRGPKWYAKHQGDSERNVRFGG